MAFTRYSTGSRRVAIAVQIDKGDGDFTNIVDPAIKPDGDGTDLKAYEDSYYDDKHLSIKDGDEPTWFSIRPMSHKQRAHVTSLSGYDQFVMALRFGLSKVENYYREDVKTGEREPIADAKHSNYGGMGPAITEGWLKEADLITDVIIAVGMMVMKISEAGTPLSKGSEPQSGAE